MYILSISIHINLQNTQLLRMATRLTSYRSLIFLCLLENSSTLVAEQCAWAIGNVAGEGAELRNTLLAQGALWPLARLMLSNKGSTTRTAAWALSNLIKGPDSKAANELIGIDGILNAIIRNLEKADEELVTEVAWVVVYLSALSEKATSLIVRSSMPQLLIGRLLASENLQLLIPVSYLFLDRIFSLCLFLVLRGLGNLVAGDGYMVDSVLIVGNSVTDQALSSLIKCLKSDHRVLKKEASWAMSNIAAGSFEHKKLIFGSEATPLLMHLLRTAQFDIRREAAYTLGNLCVVPAGSGNPPTIIVEHLVAIVDGGALPGFINLVRSADIESARLGLQFLELVMRGYPDSQGPKLVETEDGIEAMERFQFHENEMMRNMANGLVDKYFGEDYGL
ncbi:Importin subunit alpha [Zea mays]|uniref:Importin subunit alpha n=1 Tax=Zea mays TaxID=4577 RepID=A0A1D6FED5_MAIZE|nr:Importin subunit alpha [Zea mays]